MTKGRNLKSKRDMKSGLQKKTVVEGEGTARDDIVYLEKLEGIETK